MNLTDYFRILFRRGWIIILAILLTAGSGYFFSRLQTPVYRATQKILLKPARNDFGLQQTMKQLISSYAARLDTDLRAAEVIDKLSLMMTPGQLHSMVGISHDLDQLLLNIDVDMTDPSTAATIARGYGDLFVQWREKENAPLRLEDRINAELLDFPQPGLFRPNTSVNVAAGGLLGLLLGGAIVFILEYLDANIVRRSEDIERYLQMPVLGTLPE